MKVECKLCGEIFEEEDFEVENCKGEITVSCPNECILYTICIKDFADIKIIKEV
jgi:hypothetical protein